MARITFAIARFCRMENGRHKVWPVVVGGWMDEANLDEEVARFRAGYENVRDPELLGVDRVAVEWSAGGMSKDEAREIALAALGRPVFYNDCEFYYWMFDFQACGRWCQMRHTENWPTMGTMEIIVG